MDLTRGLVICQSFVRLTPPVLLSLGGLCPSAIGRSCSPDVCRQIKIRTRENPRTRYLHGAGIARHWMGERVQYYAHTRENADESQWQTLEDHLYAVGEMAASFASSFGAADWARLMGNVHDIGKGSDAFQQRLRGKPISVDHSSAGAQLLKERYKQIGTQLAYAVAGHHGGLPDGLVHESKAAERSTLRERLEKPIEPYDGFASRISLPSLQDFAASAPDQFKRQADGKERVFDISFLVRMLYSCLVDADFLDTEQFVMPDKAHLRERNTLSLQEMKEKLDKRIDEFDATSSKINRARAEIRSTCLAAATGHPGVYSLTVPTGGGKTLDSLDFALTHALANGMNRIIYAIPFTSIVEQTAATFKDLFGVDSVLEHHSNYSYDDVDGDEKKIIEQRLTMENWDAPLIVTTNVQLFESLYSDKPSRCRKNHNLAKSVIILDEAQSLPDEYLEPCLAAIEELAESYGSTIVLCTATQPALEAVWPFGHSAPTEIVPSSERHTDLFESRVQIENIGEISVDSLADRIIDEPEVLCIVSTRGAAYDLYQRVADSGGTDGVFHLSALMVPKHRQIVFEEIRGRLDKGLPCRVISTQLIEAGVDVDFPTVYREVAGIDSIKQAAGRCNREGKREVGYTYVFSCSDFSVTGHNWLSRMRMLGQETIECVPDSFGDTGVEHFFRTRYEVEDTDRLDVMDQFEEIQNVLDDSKPGFPFESCGAEFKFINDNGVTLYVPWDTEGKELLDNIREGNLDIQQARSIQSYCLTIPMHLMRKLDEVSAITSYPPYLVLEPADDELKYYSNEIGLHIPDEGGDLFLSI